MFRFEYRIRFRGFYHKCSPNNSLIFAVGTSRQIGTFLFWFSHSMLCYVERAKCATTWFVSSFYRFKHFTRSLSFFLSFSLPLNREFEHGKLNSDKNSSWRIEADARASWWNQGKSKWNKIKLHSILIATAATTQNRRANKIAVNGIAWTCYKWNGMFFERQFSLYTHTPTRATTMEKNESSSGASRDFG